MTDLGLPVCSSLIEQFLNRPQRLLIGGEWINSASNKTFDVLNPSTGDVLGKVAKGEREDVDVAVKAAQAAFAASEWAEMPSFGRASLLLRLADLIEANMAELATLESLNIGNPFKSIMAVDVQVALSSLRSIAGWADKVSGSVPMTAASAHGMSYVVREPVGVVGAITPWNAPLLMAVSKIAPALAMGCTVVLKPAELSPLSSIRLGELIGETGFPAGVMNIVSGFGSTAGQALVDHPGVNKISFTGSTRVGRTILAASGGNMKRLTLELGGKSPIIVLADADLNAAASAIAREICFKTGQYCAAGTRLFVETGAHDELVQAIKTKMEAVHVGPGLDPASEMGPIISQSQLDRVLRYIAEASQNGAAIASGGRRVEQRGFFIQPTLITGVTREMSVFRDEVFGPVLTVTKMDDPRDLDSLAAAANDTDYGLGAKIWTRDIAVAHGLARRIQAGSIIVNGGGPGGRLPMGGFKQSGIGREGGLDGVLAYTELKSISMAF